MIRQILFAVYAMASAAQAQYLVERLVPPQHVAMPAVPMVTQPAEPRVFGAEKPRSHLWALPFGVFPGSAIALSTEQRSVNWHRPAWDTPGLTSELDPTRPQFPMQPISPRAYASAPNPQQPAVLPRFPMAGEPLVLAVDDPAFAVLTQAVPLATPNSAALLRLSIPDPFEQIRTIRLTTIPADDDAPSAAQDRPPLAKLPMVEPPM